MRSRRTLLLVEDETESTNALSETIKSAGYGVMTVSAGDEAAEAALRGSVDIVLLDADLGKGLGASEAAKKILSVKDLPIIFIASRPSRDTADKTAGIPRYGFLAKDSNADEFYLAVETALELFEERSRTRRSEEKLRSLVLKAPIGIFRATASGKLLEVNEEYARILGYSGREEVVEALNRTSIAEAIYEVPENRSSLVKKVRDAAGAWVTDERRYRRKDGSLITALLYFMADQENPEVLVGFYQDISERKCAENTLRESLEEKVVLMRELQHRVKNNLNVVQSMLSIEEFKTENPAVKKALKAAQSRLRAMSAVYEHLYRSSALDRIDLQSYIGELILALKDLYQPDPRRVSFITRLEAIQIDLKRAVPLCLIMNELISNTLKYAFPDGRSGSLEITLRKTSSGVELLVADDGIGLPDGFDAGRARGFGLQLISMLSQQIGGTFRVEGEKGTRCSLSFPLEEHAD